MQRENVTQKVLLIILTSLIVSSCNAPRFKNVPLCSPFYEPVEVEDETFTRVHCFCSEGYDLNWMTERNEWKKAPIERCDRMHGFTVEDWEAEVVPTGRELIRWIRKRGR